MLTEDRVLGIAHPADDIIPTKEHDVAHCHQLDIVRISQAVDDRTYLLKHGHQILPVLLNFVGQGNNPQRGILDR